MTSKINSFLPIPAVFCLLLITAGPYIFEMYMINTLIKAFFFAVAAITVDILWGYTGYLTFGQSAFFGLGAYSAGLIFNHLGFSIENAFLAGASSIVIPAVVGLLVGWLSFYHGAAPFFACVISLVLPIVVYQSILSGGSFTGSSSGLTGFDTFEFDIEEWYWIAGYLMLAVALIANRFLSSDAGKVLIAIRDNESRCSYLGLNSSLIKILLLTVCAGVAGFSGFGYGAFSGVVAPELTGFAFGTEMIIWVALSGRGTLWGPVIGTLAINVASAYLSSSIPFIWQLILGLSFVAVIILIPEGLISVILKPIMKNKSQKITIEAKEEKIKGNYEYAIDMEKVEKSYGSLSVLKDITLKGKPGELIGIIGPNGAGKTTLMRCMSDGEHRTAGKVFLCGNDIANVHPEKCVRFGLGRKFQNANIFESMTVAQCLRMARSTIDKISFFSSSKVLNLPEYALEVVRVTGLDKKLECVAKDLSHGEQQALELSMVLALEPEVVLLDEPTAGLTLNERKKIGEIFTSLAHRYGLCCLLVEHDLDFVKEIATKIVVLYQGTILMQGNAEEVISSELVKKIYAGAKEDLGEE